MGEVDETIGCRGDIIALADFDLYHASYAGLKSVIISGQGD
jgi:hypothetical protein